MTSPHELSDAEVEELLGAYALDACEPDEVAADRSGTRPTARPRARGRAAHARRGVDRRHRGDRSAVDGLRADVLARARAAPVEPVVDLYLAESDQLEAAIDALPEHALDTVTANGLTARELVVHVAAQESLLAQLVGTPTMDQVVGDRHRHPYGARDRSPG